jgi:hypothetical protein
MFQQLVYAAFKLVYLLKWPDLEREHPGHPIAQFLAKKHTINLVGKEGVHFSAGGAGMFASRAKPPFLVNSPFSWIFTEGGRAVQCIAQPSSSILVCSRVSLQLDRV